MAGSGLVRDHGEVKRPVPAERIVDLCSVGGGPWASLYEDVADGSLIPVVLTDLYPNALVAQQGGGHVTAWPEPVNARQVPETLRGFRTIFSAFHHFDPEAARAMLADAFKRREGFAVFEGARRNAWTITAVTAVPFLGMRAALTVRPLRWERIFWSCVMPVVPAVLWIDGILSCLRSYSLDDLRELTAGMSASDYEWQIGDAHGGRVPIRYLVGKPRLLAEDHR